MAVKGRGREVEREQIAILKILAEGNGPIGSNVIARKLKEEHVIMLSERAVRYHLSLLDGRGLTSKISKRDGRIITKHGTEELANAMVSDKVGFAIDNIERIAYMSAFDVFRLNGKIPVNISFCTAEDAQRTILSMRSAFKNGLCMSDKMLIAQEKEALAGVPVPKGMVGIATVCGIVVNAALVKNGIPIDSRFGGLLQYKGGQPWRFTEIINYDGCSLDPSEIFINSGMTQVRQTAEMGDGKILANFREVPAVCLPKVKKVVDKLKEIGVGNVLALGEPGKSVCEIPVGVNKVGMVLAGGLNPIAAACEDGIKIHNKAMSNLVELDKLVSFWDYLEDYI